ncbi:MAG: undecaprenyldiphospho-muramoylpentapeptide beta-N-acetylglucosaminyltransferase [Alphaproteobacteria bacterium]
MTAGPARAIRRPIVLAAGGSGGHIYPARALAEVLIARGHKVVLVTDRRGAAFDDALPQVEVHRVQAGAPSGRGFWGRIDGVGRILRGLFEARRILLGLRPAAVVGFGGYASVPTIMAATRQGLVTLVHEQNAVLGRANRMLAGRVVKIATAFPSIRGVSDRDSAKLARTGNPIRSEIAALAEAPYDTPTEQSPINLLVFGGSQGSRALSLLVPAAVAALRPEQRRRLVIAQQCRPEDLDEVRAAYAGIDQPVDLAAYFTDMGARLGRAQLAITRAGASTIAELAGAGRPAILIPYPYATDDHQRANAEALASAGGGWVMIERETTAADLALALARLIDAPDALADAAGHARAFGIIDAADRLADLVEDCARLPRQTVEQRVPA